MNPREFGHYMANLREDAGYESQAALARASGVWNSTIARIEDGETKKPDFETLKKLAPHLKVSYEVLMAAAGYLPRKEALEIKEPPPRYYDISDLVDKNGKVTIDGRKYTLEELRTDLDIAQKARTMLKKIKWPGEV